MYFISFLVYNYYMKVNIDINTLHHVVAASLHTYDEPTQKLTIERNIAHHDIIYLVEGEWSFIEHINGKDVEYTLKPDDILFLPAGQHSFVRMPCKAGTKTYSINITKEGNDLLNEFLNPLIIDNHFSCSNNPSIAGYFRHTCEAFLQEEPFSQNRADAYLSLLLCEIGRLKTIRIFSNEVKEIIRIINNHVYKYSNTNNLQDEIIEATGLSYKKLINKFKEETGSTIHAYLTDKKLDAVAHQIQIDPSVRLKELSDMFDFYDEFYLSKLFKKKFGMSPLDYKKNKMNKRNSYDTIC